MFESVQQLVRLSLQEPLVWDPENKTPASGTIIRFAVVIFSLLISSSSNFWG